MRERILTLRDRLNFIKDEPEWGPGRVDTFNPLKAYFNFPIDKLPQRERIGTTDFPSIWNQGQREALKMNLHWDGNNVSLEERNRSAAMGAGIMPPTARIFAANIPAKSCRSRISARTAIGSILTRTMSRSIKT